MTDHDVTPLIELTRLQGISHNYLEVDPFDFGLNHEYIAKDCVPFDPNADEIPLPFVELHELTREKLDLDAPARALLSSVVTMRVAPQRVGSNDRIRPRAKGFKLERPLLRSDDELALRSALQRRYSKVDSCKVDLWPIDEENDEGLDWPKNFENTCARQDLECISEKLLACRNAIVILTTTMSPLQNGYAHEDAILNDIPYTKNNTFQPLSPPLLPLARREHPLAISSPSLPAGTLSAMTTSFSSELRQVEQGLFSTPHDLSDQRGIEIETTQADNGDFANPLMPAQTFRDPVVFPSSPPRQRREDLKIEGPVTPACERRSLTEIAVPESLPDLSSISDRLSEKKMMSEDDRNLLLTSLEPFAVDANNALKIEQFQASDTLDHLVVYALPSYGNKPPWRSAASRAQAEDLLCEIALPVAKLGLHHWPGLTKIERGLLWSPFPMETANLATGESIECDDSAECYLPLFGDQSGISHERLTWKPDGTRILDCDENNEQLEYAPQMTREFERTSFQKRRRFEASEHGSRSETCQTLPNHKRNEARLHPPAPSPVAPSEVRYQIKKDSHTTAYAKIFSDTFSASQKLDLFMDLQFGRASKRSRTEEPLAISTRDERDVNKVSDDIATLSYSNGPNSFRGDLNVQEQSYRKLISIPVPNHLPQRAIIISSYLLSHRRSFVRALSALYPALDIVERDFSLHHSYQAGIVRGVMETEDADITIHPGTGIVLTSLQKIKQKPLPGPNNTTHHREINLASMNIRDRISRIAPRYEKLFVLVSAGRSGSITSVNSDSGLEERDSSAMLDLTIFASAIDSSVFIDFIPEDEKSLVRWVAGLIANTPGGKLDEWPQLLPEETLWEVFLRRAGMNALAAQWVLGELKQCRLTAEGEAKRTIVGNNELDGYEGDVAVIGLPEFAIMSAEERKGRFQKFFQGSKVLNRVSILLSVEWL